MARRFAQHRDRAAPPHRSRRVRSDLELRPVHRGAIHGPCHLTDASSPPPRGPGEIVVFTLPPGIIATRPPDVVSVGGETGDPEVLETERWTSLGPRHTARGDVAEAVLNDHVYVIGGTGTAEDGREVFRYDVRTGNANALQTSRSLSIMRWPPR